MAGADAPAVFWFYKHLIGNFMATFLGGALEWMEEKIKVFI